MQLFNNLVLFSLATLLVMSHSPRVNVLGSLSGPTPDLPTNSHASPRALDDLPILSAVLSGLGIESMLTDPVGVAHNIVDSAFDTMAVTAAALPGDGPTIAKLLVCSACIYSVCGT